MFQNNSTIYPTLPAGQSLIEQKGEGFAPPVLLQYWQVVLRWKWVILGIMLVALAFGLIATLLTTPRYTATSRIEISREKQNITQVESLEYEQTGRVFGF